MSRPMSRQSLRYRSPEAKEEGERWRTEAISTHMSKGTLRYRSRIEEKKKARRSCKCRSACRSRHLGTEVLELKKEKSARNRGNVEVAVEAPTSISTQISARFKTRRRPRVLGLFREFPSYFDIPINRPLCLSFQFVQKFRGQRGTRFRVRVGPSRVRVV